MKISERAVAGANPPGIKDIPEHERPISETFRLQADEWATAEHVADLHETLKNSDFELLRDRIHKESCAEGNKISLNEASRLALMSDEWREYLRQMAAKRYKANAAWGRRKAIELGFQEWVSRDSNARKERQMGRQAT